MTDGGGTPPGGDPRPRREPPVLGWRARLDGLQRTILRQPLMLGITDGMRAFDRAGGGMLAGALAYFAFFIRFSNCHQFYIILHRHFLNFSL